MNSRFMRLFQAALDTCLGSPFFASLSVHGLHFTVYAPSSRLALTGGWKRSQPEIYPVQNWSLEMPEEPFSRPQPQYWIKFLDPWVHDLYPVLG